MIESFSGQYRFLSNFYPVDILYYNIIYPSLEHAFQAAKTKDDRIRIKIQQAINPGVAKRIGNSIELRPDWENVKDFIMLKLLRRKFANSDLGLKLIETDNEELIEGNTWGDVYWGVCNGVGKNKLGRLLMKVRKELLQD